MVRFLGKTQTVQPWVLGGQKRKKVMEMGNRYFKRCQQRAACLVDIFFLKVSKSINMKTHQKYIFFSLGKDHVIGQLLVL